MAITATSAAMMVIGLTQGIDTTAWASDSKTSKLPASIADNQNNATLTIKPSQRENILGKGWEDSADRAWTTTSDADGFHLLVADKKNGYSWRTAASLSEPGFDTDMWIGNACVTGSGKNAVVAYAPRTFTNKTELMSRGAFTAVVDLASGKVTKLNRQASLAYFSPGCGTGEMAVFTQAGGENKNATRLLKVDAASGTLGKPIELKGQVTSAVPVGKDIVAADDARLVKIDDSGKRTAIARTAQIPFELKPDGDGGVVYLDRPISKSRSLAATASPKGEVRRITAQNITEGNTKKAKPSILASGMLTKMDLSRSAHGTVFITGETTAATKLPRSVKRPTGTPKEAQATTHGEALVTDITWAEGKGSRVRPEEALSARTVKIGLKSLTTGKSTGFKVAPSNTEKNAATGRALSPSLAAAGTAKKSAGSRAVAGSPNDPVEDERYCAVPRNDPRKQAMQPKPRQVEWAVDQAITNNLDKHISRPANWKNTGMSAYQPQSLFPRVELDGGGRIPAQVMLGITAQESNMWQAARMAVPGVTANPLIGNYYGIEYNPDGNQSDAWGINWAKADCGYGITQITDGMRLHGKEKTGEKALTTTQQEAAALDYTANIASGINVLIEKWNQTRRDGMVINNGKPQYMENWFYALWAYNSGYYPKDQASKNDGMWGVGFTNNPANPLWKANRTPFLEDEDGHDRYKDASHPQDWPYQEKVLGWAARPLEALESPGKMVSGFRPAWWTNNPARTTVKPPEGLFCTSANSCDKSKIGPNDSNQAGLGACTRQDLKCWWNEANVWKNCDASQCGNEILRFDPTYKEEADGEAYKPNCSKDGLPSGVLVVDDLPRGTPTTRPGCGDTTSDGTFKFTFAGGEGGNGLYPSKMDTHQLGSGYNGHFYFAHTRGEGTATNNHDLTVTGTWTLGQQINGWARVMVHTPDNGAHTRQAKYVVDTGKGKKFRVVPQRTQENKWVSLGVFEFSGTPRVSLDNHSLDGDGSEDIAWDAVAFQKLSSKPKDFVVAMGDSYSSGEGASKSGGGDYYKETDVYGDNEKLRNGCHRSRYTWSRQAKLADSVSSIGDRADSWDSSMDYHLIACSGATTDNILPGGAGGRVAWDQRHFGELTQMDQGYLDENTTLVTISIGGNDSRFSKIVTKCIFGGIGLPEVCQEGKLDGDSESLKDAQPKFMKTTVRSKIVETLKAIHAQAPNAKVVLMGYPILLEKAGSCVPGIGSAEAPWINEMGDLMLTVMNDATAEANAAGANSVFSNPKEFFKGKAICGDPESVHGIVTDKTPSDNPSTKEQPASAQSFHPKVQGARLYADSLENTLRKVGM
ncbi:NocE [Streptomyces triculaminicus]|uniref:NocE n=1 Tax=Streptomyces triculaminicus TaxID=2816232 RepID=A0A939JRH3_9ACTN|nr:GDSL-type esterase/lipase family protein [Streptomyces triculaminicus]MBO0654807.1 NocE [Streptomyces triculaminicus]